MGCTTETDNADSRDPIGLAIEEILLRAEASFPGEWEGQILYLPLG